MSRGSDLFPSPTSETREAPVADWIDTDELWNDPYPSYSRLRAEAPVAYVPSLNRYFVSRFQDCFDIEMDQETFSSAEDESRSLMVRAMGRPLIRYDDPEHKVQRNAFALPLRPRSIKARWRGVFEETATKYIDRLREIGPGADLFHDFAIPYVAEGLGAILGLRGADAVMIERWSHALVAGTGNVGDDPDIWARTTEAFNEIDDVIDESLRHDDPHDVPTMLQSMVASGISDAALRANVKLTIAGGMNEPSHAITCGIWALLNDPEQRALVESGEHDGADVFQEAARVVSPVGMYPRVVTRDVEISGYRVPEGATIALLIGSANRDEERFERADVFDLRRESKGNIAFGNGTHVCAGNWVARDMVGEVAFPRLLEAFPSLALAEPDEVEFVGWVFRGTDGLPVTW